MTSFNIGDLHPNTPHLFADLAELLLLIGYNGRAQLHQNDLEKLLNEQPIAAEEVDEEDEDAQAEKTSAERNSRQDRQIEDVMSQLAYRAGAFGEWYPFEVKGENLRLHPDLSNNHRLYRLLVACSRLRSFGRKGVPQRWARGFTHVSCAAMRALAPKSAQTRIFDANSLDRQNHYGTDLRNALPILGKELGVLSINEAECANAESSGDGGFDIVTTLNFDDGAATAYAILGQCGAQETAWPSKTLEASPINFRHYYQVQFDYPSVMFTPVSYRLATGTWVNNKCANGVLLADRLRIMNLINLDGTHDQLIAEQWFNDFEAEFSKYAAN